jgi:hypothetical protein
MKKATKRTKQGRSPRASRSAGTVYSFKVALKHRKSIWRRIEARNDQTLDDLHWKIYDAFDRDDEHLYEFLFPAGADRGRDWRRLATRYVHPYCLEDPFGADEDHDAATTRLSELNSSRDKSSSTSSTSATSGNI